MKNFILCFLACAIPLGHTSAMSSFCDRRVDQQVSSEDIIKHARRGLAGFKCPKEVVFRELPKTATGTSKCFYSPCRV